ncbi:MAG: hypothetical protein AAGH15_05710 [Myxococcota bacterium]
MLHAAGSASEAQRADVEQAVVDAVRALGHEVLRETFDGDPAPPPETANELRAIAEVQGAEWALVPLVRGATERAYEVTFRVGWAPETRIEVLAAEVVRLREAERLEELLAVLLSPDGAGATPLAGEDTEGRRLEARAAEDEIQAEVEARRAAEEAERRAEEEAQRAAEEAAERERLAREAEEARLEAERAFEQRDRYGIADGLLHVQIGAGALPLLTTGQGGSGGTLGSFSMRIGRGFEQVPGLELRAGFDAFFGAASAFALEVGGVYLYSPFAFPLHVGGGLELGLFKATTGSQEAGFLVRVGPVVAFNLGESPLYVEAALPEVVWTSVSGGAMALGFSGRVGLRF